MKLYPSVQAVEGILVPSTVGYVLFSVEIRDLFCFLFMLIVVNKQILIDACLYLSSIIAETVEMYSVTNVLRVELPSLWKTMLRQFVCVIDAWYAFIWFIWIIP